MFMVEDNKKRKKQFTLEYAFYMIFSSYFKEVVVKTHFTEAQLSLYYKELPKDKQITLEERWISKLEEEILKELPENIENQKAGLYIFTSKDHESHPMRFDLGWVSYDIRVFEENSPIKKKPEVKALFNRRVATNE